jgi:hypothetical protein
LLLVRQPHLDPPYCLVSSVELILYSRSASFSAGHLPAMFLYLLHTTVLVLVGLQGKAWTSEWDFSGKTCRVATAQAFLKFIGFMKIPQGIIRTYIFFHRYKLSRNWMVITFNCTWKLYCQDNLAVTHTSWIMERRQYLATCAFSELTCIYCVDQNRTRGFIPVNNCDLLPLQPWYQTPSIRSAEVTLLSPRYMMDSGPGRGRGSARAV